MAHIRIDEDGTKAYFRHRGSFKLHREDGPALIRQDGIKGWYINGRAHRVGGPAFKGSDGGLLWFENDVLFRVDEPTGYKHWLNKEGDNWPRL